ncbi:coniferyl-aldehyde dehydrogenase [Steroidobacter denitrificans]|uniref:Aldehyde dehydrogenase n=1 Tax=Steroidobacter denitrificans TaxID=465721 RepID=A0A127F9D6_STEDE|nr:coniferyl aldehyde dehydrogenase [Steroidobacter denitrificans]AMN46179.1 coniferyl-aldehyde dehydrogenase [Steroidobacter denitrificans]
MNHDPADTDAVAELQKLLQLQQGACRAEGAVSAAIRKDRLRRAIAMLVRHRDALSEALDADFGNRPRVVSLMMDVMGAITSLKFARKHVGRWMKPRSCKKVMPFGLFGATGRVEYQPKGVVGILGTWNYPIYTTIAPLAYVLAAGNRAIIKPSELNPHTAGLLAQVVREFFDPAEVAAITGGVELGRAFSALPFDHLMLTGGTTVAKAVMRSAAENLVPLTLELGGKSPVIVGRSADIQMTAKRIMLAKCTNSGQLCINADYVCVPRERLESLITAMSAAHARLYPGSYTDNPDWVSIIDARHCSRVDGYVAEAAARGVRVETLGGPFEGPRDKRLPLRLVIDPPEDLDIMRYEIFGPALVVLSYDRLEEVVAGINARPRPLALYYFGKDATEERYVLDHTISGGVSINDVAMHPALEDAPFGGIGNSGMGRYHGYEGFLEFSHARTVFKAGWFDPRKLIGMLPPYGDGKLERMIDRVIRSSMPS